MSWWHKELEHKQLWYWAIFPKCIHKKKMYKQCYYNSTLLELSAGYLTHWGRVTQIYVGKLTIIGSDNGLSPGRRQAIIWTNAGTLLTEPLGTNFSEILIGIQIVSFKKMRLKMSSVKWRPFCLSLNVLSFIHKFIHPQGEIFTLAKVCVESIEKHLYLARATTAKLWWHLPNMNNTG